MKIDYEKIGFRCGIEIHQQLNCNKLFCNCDQDKGGSELVFKRSLSLATSELNEIDPAALFESKKNRTFFYKYDNISSCLVELDEEPPHNVNNIALMNALQAVLLFNMKPFDLIQFMRKIVIDGSNTTGFQRTALIASDGYINTSLGKVRIATLCLEEDACQIEDKKNNVYNLSRLGIPLLEIATKSDIKNSVHAKETCEIIGLTLRSLPNVKRGIGSIRQDINISISKGNRVEIKGAQDLDLIPKLIDNEIIRQMKLIEISEILKKKIKKDSLKYEIKDLSDCFINTKCKIIKHVMKKKGKVLGIKLKGFKGILGIELYKNRKIGTEVSDYAKYFTKIGGLFHLDELPNYGISNKEVECVLKELKCNKDDSFIIIADEPNKAKTALKVAFDRILMLFNYVPKEVRQANSDGSTSFLRPLPSSARMYPETDIPYIIINMKDIKKPELFTEKIKKLKSFGIEESTAKDIITRGFYDLCINAITNLNLKPTFVSTVISSKIKEIKRANKNFNPDLIDKDFLFTLLKYVSEGKISKQACDELILKKGLNETFSFSDYFVMKEDEIRQEIIKIIEQTKEKNFNKIMGIFMNKYRNKVDGKLVAKVIKEILKK